MDFDEDLEAALEQEMRIMEELEDEQRFTNKENYKYNSNQKRRRVSSGSSSDRLVITEHTDNAKRQRLNPSSDDSHILNSNNQNGSTFFNDVLTPTAKSFEHEINEFLSASTHRTVPTAPTIAKPDDSLAPLITPQERRRVHGNLVRRLPSSGDYLWVTSLSGERLYVTFEEDVCPPRTSRQASTASIMNEDFYQLIDQAQAEVRRQRELSLQPPVPRLVSARAPQKEDEILWVDKYTPRGYTELLSEENINRIVLLWLKAWDHFVFGISPSTLKKSAPATVNKSFFIPQSEVNETEAGKLDEEVDGGRPLYKMILLSGPPGLGKTTLAHVLARHAGYRVVEINASDDRNPDLFRSRLDAVVGSQGTISKDGSIAPCCLIIDEVDGAAAPAIDVLVSSIKAPYHRAAKDVPKRKHKKGPQALLRPVICICNDIYATSLRQLRPLCLVVRFPEPELSRLASRLCHIARLEGMKVDTGLLSKLAEKTDRDVRSCLNTLQFVRGQGCQELRLRDIEESSLGHKDVQRSLFAVWQEVFSIPRVQQRSALHSDLGDKRAKPGTLAARFAHVHHVVQSAGETDKVIQGIFENYLLTKFKDATMTTVVQATDWLVFYDLLQRTINSQQNYTLYRYTSYVPVLFHLLFAASTNVPKLSWPKADSEFLSRRLRSRDVLDTVKANINWRSQSETTLSSDSLPYLWSMIHSSTLKPMNTQLYSAREKAQLASTVDAMIDAGLNFRQERSSEGQYVYVLDPDLDLVVRFPGIAQHRAQLSYAAKQLIAREVGLEKMRRTERSLSKADPSSLTKELKPEKVEGTVVPPPRALSVNDQIKQVVRPALGKRIPKDFFGRVILENNFSTSNNETGQRISKTKGETTLSPLNDKIWFKFREGYCNAIRRPMKVKTLL